MTYIKTLVKNLIHLDQYNINIINCSECQTSCQSACKTSCTVSNQKCENFQLKKKDINNK